MSQVPAAHLQASRTLVNLLVLASVFFLGWELSAIPGRPGGRPAESRGNPSDLAREPDSSGLHEAQSELERLRSLGYVGGCRAPARSGVLRYDPARACPGGNLVVAVTPPGALLLDMDGNELHSWSCSPAAIRHFLDTRGDSIAPPEWSAGGREARFGRDLQRLCRWTRAEPMPDGGLLVLVDGYTIMRIDRDSNILWIGEDIHAHHDFDRAPDGTIYAIGTDFRRDSLLWEGAPLLDDFIAVLDTAGCEQRRIHVRAALENSPYATLVCQMEWEPIGDILHVNCVEYIRDDGVENLAPLRAGTLLVSVKHVDLVCAVDPETGSVYWAESDFWTRQHSPTVLDNGNLLVFNNRDGMDRSTVLEYDPASPGIRRCYGGGGERGLYSPVEGVCAPLPNGNWLITESCAGRAIEVSPEDEIVWEYVHPYSDPGEADLTALVHSVTRVGSAWRDSAAGIPVP